jgi:hypothetical protein
MSAWFRFDVVLTAWPDVRCATGAANSVSQDDLMQQAALAGKRVHGPDGVEQ